jgi:hypothetical protein
VSNCLASAFADYRLDVAGPPIDFDSVTAASAANALSWACWFLVSQHEADADVEREVSMPARPITAAQHLSADLLFRYLPQVHRRARAVATDDMLTLCLARLLRNWPLSGVLSDVTDGPDAPPDLAGHPGLQLLYAERLLRNPKPAWAPSVSARGPVELVCARLGKPMSWATGGRKHEQRYGVPSPLRSDRGVAAARFVGRDEVVDRSRWRSWRASTCSSTAHRAAKSALIRQFAGGVRGQLTSSTCSRALGAK